MITIYGRRGDGPVMQRTVRMSTALHIWGRYFMAIVHAREWAPLVVDDMTVWSA